MNRAARTLTRFWLIYSEVTISLSALGTGNNGSLVIWCSLEKGLLRQMNLQFGSCLIISGPPLQLVLLADQSPCHLSK